MWALWRIFQRNEIGRNAIQAAIVFLTKVGEASSQQPQEWVLLADALGLTSTVEVNVVRRPQGAKPNTMPGPFYRKGAPAKDDGASISIDGIGEPPLRFHVCLADLDGHPIASARIEVRQANAEGRYENRDPDRKPEFNLRGTYTSGADPLFAVHPDLLTDFIP